MKRCINMELNFKRYEGNPILKPNPQNQWENLCVLNPAVVFDKETNTLYDEKVLPITLSYNITVLCTNTQDMDELTRELVFKYMEQYFLSIQLPYESNRKIRFGLTVDPDQPIETTSRTLQYLTTGKAYQTIIHLKSEGCVLLTYTPRALPRYEQQVDVDVASHHYSEA